MPHIAVPTLDREVYETMVKSLYKDCQRASLREILANAVDANRERFADPSQSVVTVSFDIHSVTITDQGFGISPETMKTVYGAMFKSTKRSADGASAQFNGEYGIGSKTPYALLYQLQEDDLGDLQGPYHYIVDTVHSGVRYVYRMFLDDGIPSYTLMYTEATERDSGTSVTFPLRLGPSARETQTRPRILHESVSLDHLQVLILEEVLVPFLDGEGSDVPIVFQGDNHMALDTVRAIKKSIEHVSVCGPIRYYGTSVSWRKTHETLLVKYKNVLYPVSWNCPEMSGIIRRVTKSIETTPHGFEHLPDISVTELLLLLKAVKGQALVVLDMPGHNAQSTPLVNRSRDRFDFDEQTEETLADLLTEVLRALAKVLKTIQNVIATIVDKTPISCPLRKNYEIEKLIEWSPKRLGTTHPVEKICENFQVDVGMLYDLCMVPPSMLKLMERVMCVFHSTVPSLKHVIINKINLEPVPLANKIMAISGAEPRVVDDTLEAPKVIRGCTIKNKANPKKLKTWRLGKGYRFTYELLCRDDIAFLIRDTRGYTDAATTLLSDPEKEYTKLFVFSAKDITKEDFVNDGVTSVYYTSEFVTKADTIPQKSPRMNPQEEVSKKVCGIRDIVLVSKSWTQSLHQRNRKTISIETIDTLLHKHSGNVFYCYNDDLDTIVTSDDGVAFQVKKMAERYEDVFEVIRVDNDETILKKHIHQLLPSGAVVFYLEQKYKESHRILHENGHDLTQYFIEWIGNLSTTTCENEPLADLNHGIETLRLAGKGESTIIEAVEKFIFGANKYHYFGSDKTPQGCIATRQQQEFTKMFVTPKASNESVRFVTKLYNGFKAQPELCFIVKNMRLSKGCDGDAKRYFDYVLEQLGVKKFEKHG